MIGKSVRFRRHTPAWVLFSLLVLALGGTSLRASPAHAQEDPSGPRHAPSSGGEEPATTLRPASAEAKATKKNAKSAFRSFANAGTPKELATTITRTTAFEFGAPLLLNLAAVRKAMEKTPVEKKTRSSIRTQIKTVMKKYRPAKKPKSQEERFRKMRANGHAFFLDMVKLSNKVAEKLGTESHVNMQTFLGNIPAEEHWTFEKMSASKVNVILTGDRVEIGEHSFLMSRPPVVVKKNGSWKVQITGVSRYSLFPSSGERLRLREPISISQAQFDEYFQKSASLPVTGPMNDRLSDAWTTRSESAIITLSELDVSYESGRLVPEVGLRLFLPPFPHLGIPKSAFRQYNGEIQIDQVTDQQGNTYSSGFWNQEVVFTYDSRFATPDGMGPAMEKEYSQELGEEGLAPKDLSKIRGSVTFSFPINAENKTVAVSERDNQTALQAGGVNVQVTKKSDRQFTLVYPREKQNLILRLYGLTKNGDVQPLEVKSSDFDSGTFTSTVETQKPVQEIGLSAGSSLYEKTVPFELDFTTRRASIPLFTSGAKTTLGGAPFEVVNSTYSKKESRTHIFLRQGGPVTDGLLAGTYYDGVQDPSTGSRTITVGYSRFLRYEKKPKRLLLYLVAN